jgi:hypothetical protein
LQIADLGFRIPQCGTNQQAANSEQLAGAIVIAVIYTETLISQSETPDPKSKIPRRLPLRLSAGLVRVLELSEKLLDFGRQFE